MPWGALGVPGPGLGPIILWTEPGDGSGPGLGPKIGPGDKPGPGEGPGWDIPGVSEGVDIDQIAVKEFQTALCVKWLWSNNNLKKNTIYSKYDLGFYYVFSNMRSLAVHVSCKIVLQRDYNMLNINVKTKVKRSRWGLPDSTSEKTNLRSCL